jgi:hypothetical protein
VSEDLVALVVLVLLRRLGIPYVFFFVIKSQRLDKSGIAAIRYYSERLHYFLLMRGYYRDGCLTKPRLVALYPS